MPELFYMILTSLGLAELAAAIANNTTVELAEMAVGDSNGAYYAPAEGQTELVNEVYRDDISSLVVDDDNPNWLVCKLTIPATVGGWEVREVGIFTVGGNLFAVGKVPMTYKPEFSEGAGKDLVIKAVCEVSNSEAVTLEVDPSAVLASLENLDDHNNDPQAHLVRREYIKIQINDPISIPNGVATVVEWENKISQRGTGFIWDAENPSVVTIAEGAAFNRLRVFCAVLFQSNAVGSRSLQILKNTDLKAQDSRLAADGMSTALQCTTAILGAVAGDTVSVQVKQTSGDALNLLTTSDVMILQIEAFYE